ncbi:MAG: glucokinase [Proteobacteria bacterium ST_bin12]|nr:MAG: glucokinase [Proteobacteria bacterium ST_bin12]
MILAGDIGGTKTELAIFDSAEPKMPKFEMRFVNKEQASFEAMLKHFLKLSNESVQYVCLAVAGTIVNGRCHMPNIAWVLDEQAIQKTLDVEHIKLINDLEATAHGMLTLSSDKIMVINAGIPNPTGNLALIAAGTGLGEAILFRAGQDLDKQHYQIAASEGGHVDYAPHNALEMALLQCIWSKFGHASWERVVSGSGLANIYEFLYEFMALSENTAEPSQMNAQIMSATDRGAAIFQAAQSEESPLSIQAINIFIENYGAAAGNLALKALSTGGLYIGGGIAPKLTDYFTNGTFMQEFTNKGRFSDMLKNVPVKLILEPKTALLGAAVFAIRHRF